MKRVIAIILFGLMVTTSTEGYQILKVPVLIHHFQKHQANQTQLTFFEFISLHYSHRHHNDPHEQTLPFQHDDCLEGNISQLFSPVKLMINSIIPFIVLPTQILKPILIPECYLNDIWQPPKV